MRVDSVKRWHEPEPVGRDALVEVYRNLHTGTWSVRHRGRVIARLPEVWIRDCTLVVQPGGRRRVLNSRQKNVHAFVRGKFSEPPYVRHAMIPFTYNPYVSDSFVTVADRDPVREASWVHLRSDMTAWMALISLPPPLSREG